MKNTVLFAIAALTLGSSYAIAQSQTEKEVTETIVASNAFSNKNLKSNPDNYSSKGALEFWSSGGLLQEIAPTGRPDEYETISIMVKNIRVITLVEGQAAVANYYSEGSMKPKTSAAVNHYMTRVTQVFVKEAGKWKVRSSHWSPITGGTGTSQTTQ
ncbi:MAG: nuclear transport factor 2 family protein [Acidobacteriota bacterium]